MFNLTKVAPPNAKLRRATLDDFDVLYQIWMADHVNPFMSFEPMSKDEFQPIFESLFKSSEVYVIEQNGAVVAARRVSYGSGSQAHIAELASFGVHPDHLRKGFGELFYKLIIEHIRKERPDITRIEITQETDNPPAAHLAKKMSFTVEAIFPDWLIRTSGTHQSKWYIGESFLALALKPCSEPQSLFKKFTPELPTLSMNDVGITIAAQDDQATASLEGKLHATCQFSSGVRRYAHIQFWTLKLEPDCDPKVIQIFLRALAMKAAKTHKKIEVFTADRATVEILATLGFHFRGEKIASCKIDNKYFNEAALDLGFFNIADAKLMLEKLKITDVAPLLESLEECHFAIQDALAAKEIDEYAQKYLENLAYQMTREARSETTLYMHEQAPWSALLDELPERLKEPFSSLALLLNHVNPAPTQYF